MRFTARENSGKLHDLRAMIGGRRFIHIHYVKHTHTECCYPTNEKMVIMTIIRQPDRTF